MRRILTQIFIVLFFFSLSCDKNDDTTPEPDLSEAGHPRILLLEGEEQQIRNLIDSDETWKKMHLAILEKSTDLLGDPVLERIMVGRRLLSTSREALKRIFFLSYSYRMTGDERYLQRAVNFGLPC